MNDENTENPAGDTIETMKEEVPIEVVEVKVENVIAKKQKVQAETEVVDTEITETVEVVNIGQARLKKLVKNSINGFKSLYLLFTSTKNSLTICTNSVFFSL